MPTIDRHSSLMMFFSKSVIDISSKTPEYIAELMESWELLILDVLDLLLSLLLLRELWERCRFWWLIPETDRVREDLGCITSTGFIGVFVGGIGETTLELVVIEQEAPI